MFLEPYQHITKTGCIEVICGSMFSGKTEELLRRMKRAQIAHLNTLLFKPIIDTRYSHHAIVSHDDKRMNSISITHSKDIIPYIKENIDIVGIDEAQFFDSYLPQVVTILADRGIRVIIAGLDLDYLKQPFGTMPTLLAYADYVTKLHAICMRCGNIAQYTYRKDGNSKDSILLGAEDTYEALCRKCYHEATARI